MWGSDLTHQFFRVGYKYFPSLGRLFFKREPGGRLDLSDEKRLEMLMHSLSKAKGVAGEKDRAVITEDYLRLWLRSSREAFAQGFDAVVQDGKVMSVDWGFRIEDIRPDLPVQIWHGKLDSFVPLSHAQYVAARLGDRAQLRVEDETHSSIQIKFRKEILEELLKNT